MLIDCSCFTKGPRHIRNASLGVLPNPDAVEVNRAIEAYIAEYQEQFLCDMLGSRHGHNINAYLLCIEEDADTKVMPAFDDICKRLRESFADYVFFHILRENNTQATMTGLVRLKCANEYVAPIRRQVMVWNRMVERNRRFKTWIISGNCPLPGVVVSDNMTTKINQLNI